MLGASLSQFSAEVTGKLQPIVNEGRRLLKRPGDGDYFLPLQELSWGVKTGVDL